MTTTEPESESLISEAGRVDVTLTGVQETLLVALMARAADAQTPKPILNDTWATQTLQKITHDSAKFGGIDSGQRVVTAIRGRYFDNWTSEFLNENPNATVVHLACGLDSRCLRLGHGPGVRWIDVDVADVATLRAKVLPVPEGEYELLAADVTEEAWLEQIPADRPTLVVGEGLMMYLEESAVECLIKRLVEHFKEGGQIIFDCIGTRMLSLQDHVKAVKATGSSFKWAIDDPKALEQLHPRLKIQDSLRPAELDCFNLFPFFPWIVLLIFWYLPSHRNTNFYVRIDFLQNTAS